MMRPKRDFFHINHRVTADFQKKTYSKVHNRCSISQRLRINLVSSVRFSGRTSVLTPYMFGEEMHSLNKFSTILFFSFKVHFRRVSPARKCIRYIKYYSNIQNCAIFRLFIHACVETTSSKHSFFASCLQICLKIKSTRLKTESDHVFGFLKCIVVCTLSSV